MARQKAHFALDDRCRAMIIRESVRNHWRVKPDYERKDLIQEGYLIYWKCSQLYSMKVRNYAHFMCLVRTAFMRRVTDLANARSREREALGHFVYMQQDRDMGEALAVDLPPELVKYLNLMASEGLKRPARQLDGRLENSRDYACRMVGVAKGSDLDKAVEYALTGRSRLIPLVMEPA